MRKLAPSSEPVVLKAQHDPHCPWFLMGVTAPKLLELNTLGRPVSSVRNGSWGLRSSALVGNLEVLHGVFIGKLIDLHVGEEVQLKVEGLESCSVPGVVLPHVDSVALEDTLTVGALELGVVVLAVPGHPSAEGDEILIGVQSATHQKSSEENSSSDSCEDKDGLGHEI